MARLSLIALALWLSAIPAMTWSFVPNTEELEQEHREEDDTLWHAGSRRYSRAGSKEGLRTPRALYADLDPTIKWIMEARSSSGGPDTHSQAIPGRDYLNGLVETSVASVDSQEGNIALVKTRKTASTAMAAILYRYAIRHDLKLAEVDFSTIKLERFAAEVQNGRYQRVDIMHQYVSPNGHLDGHWADAKEKYRGVMRDPDNINFVTVMREPRSHFISYYYEYLAPVNKLSVEGFLKSKPRGGGLKLLTNPLSSEFGVTSYHDVEQLIVDELSSFKLILMTDRFDEGLMVLRRLLGWSMIDMTYMKLNETKAGSQWQSEGNRFVDRPSFDDLPEQVQNRIDKLTELDQILYTATQVEYDKRLRSMSDVIDADLEEFEELQKIVSDYLNANDSSKANAMYRAEDVYSRAPPLSPF